VGQQSPSTPGVINLKTFLTADEVAKAGLDFTPRDRSLRKPVPYSIIAGVELTAEKVQNASVEAQMGNSGDVLIVDCHGSYDYEAIQEAIDAAVDGDTVIVLPNTCTPESRYYESIDFLGKEITVQSVFPEDPELVAATVIDGSLSDLSVVTMTSGETEYSILAGLTITGGSGTLVSELYSDAHAGGGVLVLDSSTTIRHCRIIANSAAHGGGIAAFRAVLQITDSIISSNLVQREGSMFGFGPGLLLQDASVIMARSKVISNETFFDSEGGSPYAWAASTPGMMLRASQPGMQAEVNNCEFRDNYVTDVTEPGGYTAAGGAIEASAYASSEGASLQLAVNNSLIANNRSGAAAGLMLAGEGLTSEIRGCTIAGNIADFTGTVMWYEPESTATVTNSIIYGNVPADVGPDNSGPLMEAIVDYSYSDVETSDGSVVEGPGNVNLDPVFVDWETGDYHLARDSSLIEAGDPDFVSLPGETDIDGDPRLICQVIDMGSDEVQLLSGDIDRNGVLNVDDLHALVDLLEDGMFEPADYCTADLNEDGVIDFDDLHELIDLVLGRSFLSQKMTLKSQPRSAIRL